MRKTSPLNEAPSCRDRTSVTSETSGLGRARKLAARRDVVELEVESG